MLGLAFACLGLLVYTYVGYPLLVALAARLWPAPRVTASSETPLVSVCLPVFNAEGFIDAKLESLLGLDWPAQALEVLVFDDGSSDGTAAALAAWERKEPRVRLFRGEGRAGKPSALNRLAAEARGEVLFLTDVRQLLHPAALRALVRILLTPDVGMVSGNLELRGAAGSGMYWRYEKWIRANEARFRSLVGVSGAVAAVRKADLPALPSDLILDDVYTPLCLRLAGRRVVLAQDALAYDEAFEDDREFARKVRTLAGNFQLFAKLPRLLVPIVNPSWFETVSHKLARLLCPVGLFGLLLASVALSVVPPAEEPRFVSSQAAGVALLLGQSAFYVGALAGRRAGKLGTLCRTFVVLHMAVVVGFCRFLRGRQRVTW